MPLQRSLSEISDLDELKNNLDDCGRCSLSGSRTNLVFGNGDPNASLMFVGEAPGFHEDQKGEPFVGAAGKLLDQLLKQILGLNRSNVYIANVLKCRPPENRDPKPEEISACKPFMLRQIEIVDPLIVVTLGNFSTRLLLDRTVFISKIHGEPIIINNRRVFPVYHPAAALYATKTKELLIEDFKKLGDLLIEADRDIEREQNSKENKGEEQLDLF